MDVNNLGGGVRSDCSWPSVSSCARILLVDHNPVSLVHTASLLQEQLYNAKSAALALKFFEARNGLYHVVMADIYMQDMNIYDFIQRIRDQCLSGTPIILMAEDYRMDLGKEALQKGASYFIQKPLTPIDVAYLWQQIVHLTGRIPGVTSIKHKKRGFCNSDEGNGKRRKNLNAEGPVTFTEARQSKTLNTRNNEHGCLRASSYLHKDNGGKSHPNVSTVVGVQQIINELNSNIALNGTTENVIMNTGRVHVAGQNGGIQISMEGGQVTPTNGYMMGALQVPNKEPSGDLGGGIYRNINTGNMGYMNNGSDQLAGGNGGVQIFLEGGQLTPGYGYVTGSLQVLKQEASGELGKVIYSNGNTGNGGYMNTGSNQVAARGNGGVQIFMEGSQVTPRNGFVTSDLQVPSQEASSDLGTGIYCTGNTGGGMITGQGSNSPDSTIEVELTADDIAEMVRSVQEEDWTLAVGANSNN